MCQYPVPSRTVAEAGRPAIGLTTFILAVLLFVGPYFAETTWAQVPGPELFAKEPQTPLELWGAVDYLIRTGQVKQALPYLDKFAKSRPDDATLIMIRNQYGPGSILRLIDDPTTRPYARPFADALAAASRRYATQPERIARLIGELTGTPDEQDYAVRHLREAGPYAIPPLVDALTRPGLSAQKRDLLVRNMGRLDATVTPALTAVLDSPDPEIAAAAATALGSIGDQRAVPFLTIPAASATAQPALRTAAQEAIARLTGRPFSLQSRTPVQVLVTAAWSYHRHEVEFADDPVVVWTWDNARKAPVPREQPRTGAEALLGLRFAREALRLDPTDRNAQVAQVSLALEKAVERVGYGAFPANDQATFGAATASGPLVLSDVLRTAIADGKTDLAAVAVMALAQVTDATALSSTGRPHPLVDALYAPGRRTQFAAAKAIVDLAPTDPFPGSSRVVPTLARFATYQALPRAVIIDGNPNRGSQFASFLISLGYDAELELTGSRGFIAAAQTADVDLILVSYDLFGGFWDLNDTLTNLKADSRTAAIPLFIYGPLDLAIKRPNLDRNFPGLRFLVQPGDASLLQPQLRGLPPSLSELERSRYARQAVALLATVATQGRGPLVSDLPAAEPALAAALSTSETSAAAALALGNIPDPLAQRGLADLVLDFSRAPELRSQAAAPLTRSIERFGPLITAGQEARLSRTLPNEPSTDVRAGIENVIRALRAFKANAWLRR
jgi:HEAT repeat protein